MSNTPAYNYVSRVRVDPECLNKRQGGGVSVGIDRLLVFRDISELIPPLLADLEIVFVQIVHDNFELFILNIYVNNY
jgi:hypothetical protein